MKTLATILFVLFSANLAIAQTGEKVASQDPVGGTEVRLRQEDGTPNTVTLKMYSSLFD